MSKELLLGEASLFLGNLLKYLLKHRESMTELITTKEAAFLLERSIDTINKYVQRKKLAPTQKIGCKYFFEKEIILRFKRTLSAKKSPPIKKKPSLTRSINRPNFKTRTNHGLPEVEMMDIIEKWQVNSRDTSSADVEIGVHTEKIFQIEDAIKRIPTENPDFKLMRYKLLWHVGERRKLLHYLEISDYGRYRRAIALLEKEAQA